MPDHSHKFGTPKPTPTVFDTCGHSSLMTPSPRFKRNSNTPSSSPTYGFRCLSCDINHRQTQQALSLETYNGLIDDQRARLLIAYERRGTNREGRFDEEMVTEGERRIRSWEITRATEVARVFNGFLERWNGGKSFEKGREEKLALRLKVARDGGYVVEGLPRNLGV